MLLFFLSYYERLYETCQGRKKKERKKKDANISNKKEKLCTYVNVHGRVDLQLCVSIMKLRLKSARSGEATFFSLFYFNSRV